MIVISDYLKRLKSNCRKTTTELTAMLNSENIHVDKIIGTTMLMTKSPHCSLKSVETYKTQKINKIYENQK